MARSLFLLRSRALPANSCVSKHAAQPLLAARWPTRFSQELSLGCSSRTDYVRGMALDSDSSEQEVAKAAFQLGPRNHNTQRPWLLFLLFRQLPRSLGRPSSLKRWVPYHSAWLNVCVVAALASNDELAMKQLRMICSKNRGFQAKPRAHSQGCGRRQIRADLGAADFRRSGERRAYELVRRAERFSKVAGAPFGQDLSNLRGLRDGNSDSFKAVTRSINPPRHCSSMQVFRMSSRFRISER